MCVFSIPFKDKFEYMWIYEIGTIVVERGILEEMLFKDC